MAVSPPMVKETLVPIDFGHCPVSRRSISAVSRRSPDSNEPWVATRSSRQRPTSRDGLTEAQELQGVGKLAAADGTQRVEEGDRHLMPGGAGYGAERETD